MALRLITLLASREVHRLSRIALVLIAAAVIAVVCGSPAGSLQVDQAKAQSSPCSGFGAYGYVHRRAKVSCANAKRIAAGAAARGIGVRTDCGPSRTSRYGVWTVRGPLAGGLTYRFTAAGGSKRFYTTKPTEC